MNDNQGSNILKFITYKVLSNNLSDITKTIISLQLITKYSTWTSKS